MKNQRKKFCRWVHGELTAKKWLDSTEKQKKKKQLEVCDKQTDRQSQLLTIMIPRLGMEINGYNTAYKLPQSQNTHCDEVI